MLLLHQQVEFVEAIQGGSEFLLVITERLAQTNEGKAAFVFDFVAHDEIPVATGGAAKLRH
jgi:hypothetical protein